MSEKTIGLHTIHATVAELNRQQQQQLQQQQQEYGSCEIPGSSSSTHPISNLIKVPHRLPALTEVETPASSSRSHSPMKNDDSFVKIGEDGRFLRHPSLIPSTTFSSYYRSSFNNNNNINSNINRDPLNIHDKLTFSQIAFEEIFAEPHPGVYSFDAIWSSSHAVFDCVRLWTYRILSICGVVSACCFGFEFACQACCIIWCWTPSMKLFLMILGLVKQVCSTLKKPPHTQISLNLILFIQLIIIIIIII